MNLSIAFLQGGGLGAITGLLPFALVFLVFYFLLIVPQRKRQKALEATISALKAGDRIVTSGGVVGTITAVKEKTLLVRSAEKSILEVSRTSVAGLFEEEAK